MNRLQMAMHVAKFPNRLDRSFALQESSNESDADGSILQASKVHMNRIADGSICIASKVHAEPDLWIIVAFVCKSSNEWIGWFIVFHCKKFYESIADGSICFT
ncbi:hypothetical protein AVEN_92032-1 [Araneus ventricosus]|uniref:Uncharacterized protein n=1 Tax=Araneus ventricosus TaxID=182803 RepID=A0A4Y2T1I1_ARAVE|nr:hypothetical protein AVEN_92032-1 [Araneus ventricosus]